MTLNEELRANGITPAQYEEIVKTIIQKKNEEVDMSWQDVVDAYGLTVPSEVLRINNGGLFGGARVGEFFTRIKPELTANTAADSAVDKSTTYEMKQDGSISSKRLLVMNEAQAKDPEYIMKAHGFDPLEWQVSSCRNTIREAISKDEGVVTLYASFLTVKPYGQKEIPLPKIEDFFNRLQRTYTPPVLPVLKDTWGKGNKALLIDIADLHMNLQASMFTTGNEYNCEIAEALFNRVIQDVLSRTAAYDFEKIIFVIGGDMLNADGLSGTTTHGTPQDNHLHYFDAFERLTELTIRACDTLKTIAPIQVIYCKGNHDEVAGFKLAKFVDAWYRNDSDVQVDYTPLARKYVLYGKTLLCFAHDGKAKDLPAIAANEARQYWAQADTTEVFLQHLHTEQVLMENNNIRIQRLPTISGHSKWSHDKGYGSKRQCKSFIFDREDGLTDILYTNIK